jgi:hypothetical protein
VAEPLSPMRRMASTRIGPLFRKPFTLRSHGKPSPGAGLGKSEAGEV